MTRKISIGQTPGGTGILPARGILIVIIWAGSYLVHDLMLWADGRSPLVNNVITSMPLVATATALTTALDRLRQWSHRWGLPLAVAILLPVAFGAAIMQGLFENLFTRTGAVLQLPGGQAYSPAEHLPFGLDVYITTLHFLCCLLALALLDALQFIKIALRHRSAAMMAQRHAEAKALRLQITPHFLFNALNSIAALLSHESNSVAEKMICRLSDFLRASITADPEDEVSLATELATTEAYLAIERLRFGERLSVAFTVAPDAWGAAVPPFILQPLVENAVKHGLCTPRAAIRLAINVQRQHDLLAITVTDTRHFDGPSPAEARTTGTGTGLSNIRQRLLLVDRNRARLETSKLDRGFRAKLILPYRQCSPTGKGRAIGASGGLTHGTTQEVLR